MKLTNRFNLPRPLVDAMSISKPRVMGDIAVTRLIDAPQIRILRRKHWEEIEEDAIDRVWALFGSAVHSVVEKAKEADDERYEIEQTIASHYNGMDTYGTYDLYDKEEKILYDFKVTSVWSIIYDSEKKEWQAQLNVLAQLLRDNGFEVKEAKIVAILKDWKENEYIRGGGAKSNYPEKQIKQLPITLYSEDAVKKYIDERVELHTRAEAGDVPECSEKERWSRETKYAVTTPLKKKALRVLSSEEEAKEYIESNKTNIPNLTIEVRKGEDMRCEKYCAVKQFCNQYKKNNNEHI